MTVFFFGGPCGGEFGAEHGSCGFGLLFFSPFRRKDDLSGEKKNPSVAGHVYGGSIPETAGRCTKT